MQLNTLDVPRSVAREKVAEYRRSVRERHNDEDAAILKCYRAIAGGNPIINLHDALRDGGVDEHGRPRLAIAPAHVERIIFLPRWSPWRRRYSHTPMHTFTSYTNGSPPWNASKKTTIKVPVDTWQNDMRSGAAIVPLVPPALRPKAHLSNFHILFEADWKAAPVDPALLKHVGGPFFAVLATWDLTEIERQVLGITRAAR